MPTFTVEEIAQRVAGRLIGAGEVRVEGVENLDRAEPGHLGFIRDARFALEWGASRAGAALVHQDIEVAPGEGRALIKVADPDAALLVVLTMFSPPPSRPAGGAHASAVVDPAARVDRAASVGPGCIVGAGVRIGEGTRLVANVTVMDHTIIGQDCVLYPGVVVRERCVIGDRVIIHANTVIGDDGFGYQPAPGGKGLAKIPHIGNVVIGQDVEIGAATTIDRAKFGSTIIGERTKIDNLCQIAHNVRIGRGCVIVAQVGIAGSAVIGDGVMLGGQVGVRDHATIGAGARIAASSAVAGDVPAGATWGGLPAQDLRTFWRQFSALQKLPEVMKKMGRDAGAKSGR